MKYHFILNKKHCITVNLIYILKNSSVGFSNIKIGY